MRKRILFACVTMSLIAAFCTVVKAENVIDNFEEITDIPASKLTEDIIEPFGGIKWEDSLLQLINKLNAIKGIEKIQLHLNDADISVKGLSGQKELEKKLSELLAKYNPRIFKESSAALVNHYTGKDGAKLKYLLLVPKISVSPIVIAGVPFNVSVSFNAVSGLDVVSPEAVPIEKRGGYAFPLVISEIELKSSAAGVAANCREIIRLIEAKYRKFDPDSNLLISYPTLRLEGNISDKDGRTFSTTVNRDKAILNYISDAYQKQVSEAYRNYQAAGERKANSGKEEMGSRL